MGRRRYGRRRGRGRGGLHVAILPAAAVVASAYLVFHDMPMNANGALAKITANIKNDWPLIIGLPVGFGLASRVARSVSNPRIKLGGVSVSAF